jgi:hypothetical protein
LLKRIVSNLNGYSSDSSFNYERTESVKSSEGFPVYINTSKISINDKVWAEYVSTTKNNNERMAHKKTVSIGNWVLTRLDTLKSNVNDISDNISYMITYNIFSNEARKNTGSNLGIPNPEDLTFLHITSNEPLGWL